MRAVAMCAVAVFLVSSSLRASSASDYSLPIRIGVVAFDKLTKGVDAKKVLNALGDDRPVAQYLRALAAGARAANASVRSKRFDRIPNDEMPLLNTRPTPHLRITVDKGKPVDVNFLDHDDTPESIAKRINGVPGLAGVATVDRTGGSEGVVVLQSPTREAAGSIQVEGSCAAPLGFPLFPIWGLSVEPRFQIYRGNYYQVMTWLRNGDIDGAVLSPFMAMLAIENGEQGREVQSAGARSEAVDRPDTVAIANFAYAEDAARNGAFQPIIAARTSAGSAADPIAEYGKFIKLLVSDTQEAGYEHAPGRPFLIGLVNHLSTSGFILPVIETHRILEHELAAIPAAKRKVVAQRFWELFFRYGKLTFWHETTPPQGVTFFEFTYPTPKKLASGVNFKPYLPFDPNDALLLRYREGTSTVHVIQRLQYLPPAVLAAAARIAEKKIDGDVAAERKLLAETALPHWYRYITPFNDRQQEAFERTVHQLFKPESETTDVCAGPLSDRWNKWYEAGEYDFTAEEVITLLSHDQSIRSAEVGATPTGALVLPGGGVRGTYQAALLDNLYDQGKLINAGDPTAPKVGAAEQDHDGKLVVRHVIGTSGGALVGFFAAQRHAGTGDGDSLLNQWIANGRVVATPDKIFPPIGLLRWISGLVVLMIFTIVARYTFGRLLENRLPSGRLPPMVVLGVVLAVGLAPFVLWRVARSNAAYTPKYEGAFYCAIIVLAHFVCTTTRCQLPKKERPKSNRKLEVIGALIAVGACALIYYILFRPRLPGRLSEVAAGVSAESLIGFSALLAILAAVLCYTRARGLIDFAAARSYGGGMLTAIGAFVIAWAFFHIGTAIGATSTIEMTLDYWIWVAGAAIAAGGMLTGIALISRGSRIGQRIYDAVSFWSEEHLDRRFFRTPGQSLITFGFGAILLWIVFAAPSLYSSTNGYGTFTRFAEDYRSRGHTFFANFVASTTSLGTSSVESKTKFSGDYYVCRQEDEACAELRAHRSRVISLPTADPAEFRNAVFASGSPFPIYPERLLSPDAENAGMFMDGGYTHNTPVEAAHLLNAQQVLIIHSGQRTDSSHGTPEARTVSPLAGDSATLFPFLFDRSQLLDQAVRASMFVASLAPYGGHGSDAFLMDFRESTIRRLSKAAQEDLIYHRIGEVDSWGLPTRLLDDSVMGLDSL